MPTPSEFKALRTVLYLDAKGYYIPASSGIPFPHGEDVTIVRTCDLQDLLKRPSSDPKGSCEVCWTASWEPCAESDCQFVHPHEGEHRVCAYCKLKEAHQRLLCPDLTQEQLVDVAHGEYVRFPNEPHLVRCARIIKAVTKMLGVKLAPTKDRDIDQLEL